MRSLIKIFIVFLLLLNVSCKKDKVSGKACWQLLDFSGNKLTQVCDKTEAELIDCVEHNTCGVYNFPPGSLTDCYYYKVEGDELCWVKSDGSYMQHMIDNEAALFARCYPVSDPLIRVDCNDCERWYNREKRIYKPTGSISYSNITSRYYWADTLATIYQGRQVIKKDDVDSLITIQFSDDNVHW